MNRAAGGMLNHLVGVISYTGPMRLSLDTTEPARPLPEPGYTRVTVTIEYSNGQVDRMVCPKVSNAQIGGTKHFAPDGRAPGEMIAMDFAVTGLAVRAGDADGPARMDFGRG